MSSCYAVPEALDVPAWRSEPWRDMACQQSVNQVLHEWIDLMSQSHYPASQCATRLATLVRPIAQGNVFFSSLLAPGKCTCSLAQYCFLLPTGICLLTARACNLAGWDQGADWGASSATSRVPGSAGASTPAINVVVVGLAKGKRQANYRGRAK
ncbi:uncharacterized protein B0I36DRAFT_319982 [Microdochium trichocladiopsis]|uniref:Uncharacterized protein n=1 Tax=Microdochium trichocladiopsis TaxID=1682393 RepID=A0A9P8Y901_9PEZI|nr:uncharacterized protein B0I36DRAFT_319982 [Microdochium trichocladiopsis]KAH7032761.1 hypothetical protein B0I36DRAFT_319982 [Microdochium trichocladiopsis]